MGKVTHGSLFSGIGGFDLGFKKAGIRTVWQVELSSDCRRVLERHFPVAARFADIREVSGLPRVDIISGGFPCQPFSSASRGRKRGTSHPAFLWPEMLRVIQESKPTWVCAENVVNADSVVLEQVVSDLEISGYEVAPPLEIPACAIGHDHRRSRLWILGYSDRNRKSGCEVDAETPWMPGNRCKSEGMGQENGISSRLALEMYGNAIVPQIAEFIGKAIVAAGGE